jgi:hypothetical protein
MLLEDYFFECKCQRCIDELNSQTKKTKVSYPQSSFKRPSGKNKAKRALAKRERGAVNSVQESVPIETIQIDPIPDAINPTD